MSELKDENWVFQIGRSNPSVKMGFRTPPYCFTEQGLAMLSGVLNSDRAIGVNIQIMRVFVEVRGLIAGNKEIKRDIEFLKKTVARNTKNINKILPVISKVTYTIEKPKQKVGFKNPKK